MEPGALEARGLPAPLVSVVAALLDSDPAGRPASYALLLDRIVQARDLL